MSKPRDPDAAPRGMHFEVTHLSHVAGTPPPEPVWLPGEHALRSEANKHARRIDWRLQPMVALVDNNRSTT